jgi:hypothetical protein
MATETTTADKPIDEQPSADEQAEAEKIWGELVAADEAAAAKDTGKTEPAADDFETVSTETTETVKGDKSEGEDTSAKGTAEQGTSQQQPASDAKGEDIWANAPPELRAAHEAEVAAIRKTANDAKAQAGRMRKQYEGLKASAGRAADQQSPKIGDTLDQSLADYPEIAKPVKDALAPIEKKLERLDQFEASERALQTEEVNEHIRREQTVLAGKYPNWDKDFVEGPRAKQFYDWVQDQPRAIRETVFVTNKDHIFDGRAAIDVFDAFSAHLEALENPNPPGNGQSQELSAKRAAQLDGTRSPRTPGGAPRINGIPRDGDAQTIWNAFPDDDADARLMRGRRA